MDWNGFTERTEVLLDAAEKRRYNYLLLAAALFAPAILRLLFPQFEAGGHMLELVLLTRIMLLQPVLLGLSNILAGVTQSRKRYWLYSISPLLYNLGIIFGIAASIISLVICYKKFKKKLN